MMTLSDFLTFLGLLIAAYGATQEYIRLKLKLASKWALLGLSIAFLLLYVSTWDALDGVLKKTCPIGCYLYGFWWESRHFILVSLNLILLIWIVFFSLKLRPDNIQAFNQLVKEFKAEKNQVMLGKLVSENVTKLLDLKFSGQNNYKSSKEIWELFDLTINDKNFAKSLAVSNEQLGIRVLRELDAKSYYGTEFSSAFLIAALKNPESFIHSKLIEGRSSEISDLLIEKQSFDKFDLGLNLCWAILELIEENESVMVKSFSDHQDDSVFKTIYGLMTCLSSLDAPQAHLSNLPFYIQKELLNFTKLDEEDKSIAFELLVRFYGSIAYLNANAKGSELNFNYLNYLYSALPRDINFSESNSIRLGCPYVNLIFNEHNSEFINKSIEQFKELFENYQYLAKKDTRNAKNMFLLVLSTERPRGECNDWIGYTMIGRKNNSQTWNDLMSYLTELND